MKYTPVDEETGQPQLHDWVTSELRQRGIGKTPQNTIVAILGEGTSGKSWTGARIIENLDPTYTPSLKNHPVYTGNQSSAKFCHLSSSAEPFMEALAENLLPKGSWFHLDEPPQATDWWTEVGRAMTGFLTRYNFTIVNVLVCGILKKKVLSTIRDFAHIQIDQREPGYAMVNRIISTKNYKTPTREIIRKPKWAGPIGPGADAPSEEWQKLYAPIKAWEWKTFAANTIANMKYKQGLELEKIARLRKKGYID